MSTQEFVSGGLYSVGIHANVYAGDFVTTGAGGKPEVVWATEIVAVAIQAPGKDDLGKLDLPAFGPFGKETFVLPYGQLLLGGFYLSADLIQQYPTAFASHTQIATSANGSALWSTIISEAMVATINDLYLKDKLTPAQLTQALNTIQALNGITTYVNEAFKKRYASLIHKLLCKHGGELFSEPVITVTSPVTGKPIVLNINEILTLTEAGYAISAAQAADAATAKMLKEMLRIRLQIYWNSTHPKIIDPRYGPLAALLQKAVDNVLAKYNLRQRPDDKTIGQELRDNQQFADDVTAELKKLLEPFLNGQNGIFSSLDALSEGIR